MSSLSEREKQALALIKTKKYPPAQIAYMTGLSRVWIDIKMAEAGFIGQVGSVSKI